MQMGSNNTIASSYCSVVNNEKIDAIIEAAAELKSIVEDDAEFEKIGEKYSPKLQRDLNQGAFEPIDFNEQKHKLDYHTLGNIVVGTKSIYGNYLVKVEGSAIKIGKSCILTSAHVLYSSGYQDIHQEGANNFNKLTFKIGSGVDVKEYNALVFFEMTKEGVDYTVESKTETIVVDGKKVQKDIKRRIFKSHSDLVLLRLDGHSDFYYKKTLVVNPAKLFLGIDEEVGRKISCHGSPSHMTSQKYGECKGVDFKWKQENARIFREDENGVNGVYTNLASSEGMSGGPCYLNDESDKVFGIVAGGYGTDWDGAFKLPRLKFDKNNYRNGNVRYIGLLHILDQRLKAELGYGLDSISENCR